MASLSDKEINAALTKIRSEYEKGAEKYGSKIYNVNTLSFQTFGRICSIMDLGLL